MPQLCSRSILVILLSLAACGDGGGDSPDANTPPDATAAPDATLPPMATAERGRYLVDHVMACGDCHTPRLVDGSPDLDNYLAGVECFFDANGPDPDGCLNSRNLTNDATGLLNRSDDEIKSMFLDGVRPNGDALVSVMPYWLFHNMTELDADSIVLYLRTVTAVDHTVPANDANFWPIPAQPAAAFAVDDIPMPTVVTDETMAGRYLAGLICIDCHTSRTDPTDFRSLDMTKLFAGGEAFPSAVFGFPVPPFPDIVYTMNLTPDSTGLGAYTQADVVEVLLHGVDPDGNGVCPPMPAGPMGPFGGLTQTDAENLAAYVKTLPAIANQIPNGCALPPN